MIVEKGSQNFRKIRKALRDLQQTCGPIIDIKGDQFAWYNLVPKSKTLWCTLANLLQKTDSQSRYIFNGRVRFLKIVDSNQEIASTILIYLCFDSFRTIFSENWNENDVKENIKSQDFILFEYATTQWLSHIRSACIAQNQTLPQHLINTLSRFVRLCKNKKYQPCNSSIVHPRYRGLDAYPSIQSVVSQAELHGRHCQTSVDEQGQTVVSKPCLGILLTDETDTEVTSFADSDSNLVSRAQARFRHCLESLLCHSTTHENGCACQEIKNLYGCQLFKCNRFRCPYYNEGFDTYPEREIH